ncbi:rhomboid-related protein 2 [Teleopsis dalmanni]|uniref:rhomboid-related protein 2 n=1 Tax=Teleopsis dalmanni TaxID=139649 RepID=UPI0018CE25C1|nr:rhomboid-related protein 2 [Teleopsis dalmanni]
MFRINRKKLGRCKTATTAFNIVPNSSLCYATSIKNAAGMIDGNSIAAIEDGVCPKSVTETDTLTDAVALTLPLNATSPISGEFIADLTEKRSSWRIPWLIVNISLVQFTLFFVANESIKQRFMYIPRYRTQYWRHLSYMLLHTDHLHLLLNLCLQFLIGFCLESEQRRWKVAIIYAAGGVSGSLAISIFQPQFSLVGASAGIYALLMSHIPHLVKNFSHLPYRYFRLVALVILCLSDICFTSFHFLINRNASPHISLEAHIAGGITGLCLGFLIYRDGGPMTKSGYHSTSTGSTEYVTDRTKLKTGDIFK